jgi:hypothetical protein
MLQGHCQHDGGEAHELVPTPASDENGPIATASFDGFDASLVMSSGYGQDTFILTIERGGVRLGSASGSAMIHYLGRSLREYVDALLPSDLTATDRALLHGALGGYDAQSLSLLVPLDAEHRVECDVFFWPATSDH